MTKRYPTIPVDLNIDELQELVDKNRKIIKDILSNPDNDNIIEGYLDVFSARIKALNTLRGELKNDT